MNQFVAFLVFVTLLLFALPSTAQKCEVLNENLNESYRGDCKRGLAHGKGKAKGADVYEGSFKKGKPHGKGTCKYQSGATYTGYWKDGKRNGHGTFKDADGGEYKGDWSEDLKDGEGKYFLKINEQDTLLTGIWKEDEYVGPKPKRPYMIVSNRGIDRVTMFKMSDGNRLVVKIMQNGSINYVTDFRFAWDSGTELSIGGPHEMAWENMEYPFEGRISYTTPNKLKSGTYSVILEFIINEPGNWELVLHN